MGTGVGIAISPGEKVLWSGTPPRGLILRASDVFLVPFSIVWASGALIGVFSMKRRPPGSDRHAATVPHRLVRPPAPGSGR